MKIKYPCSSNNYLRVLNIEYVDIVLANEEVHGKAAQAQQITFKNSQIE